MGLRPEALGAVASGYFSEDGLLHTILEVHLRECALQAMEWKGLRFAPDDIRGRGIEAYATDLAKSDVFNVTGDKAWSVLKDLRDLGNLIVHGAGTPTKQKTVSRLKQNLKEGFEDSRTEGNWWNEVWVSLDLCHHFTDEVEEFAGRCWLALNSVAPREANSVYRADCVLPFGAFRPGLGIP